MNSFLCTMWCEKHSMNVRDNNSIPSRGSGLLFCSSRSSGGLVATAMRRWTGASTLPADAKLNACLTFINVHLDSLSDLLTNGTASKPLLG